MAAFQIFTQPSQQALDTAANVLSGATLTFSLTGTSTATNAYSDSTLTTPVANPLSANSAGVFIPVFLDPTIAYRVVLKTQAGVVLQTWDPANEQLLSASLLGFYLNPTTAAETAAAVVPTAKQYPVLNPYRYGADGLAGANDTTAMTRVRSVLAQLSAITGWQNDLAVPGWEQSASEATSLVTPNFRFPSDASGTLNVFRFFTAAQIAAVQAGSNTTDVSAAIQAANDFLEGRAARCILTLTVSAGGSGYTNGTYDCVAMTGGTGTNAKCRIVVAGGAITSVKPAGPQGTNTVNAAGLGNFTVGDVLTPATDASSTSALYFPAGGSGAVITVATVSTASGKTASGLPSGGKLFFPPGYYYCGTSSLRVGAFVEWQGNSQNGVQIAWASGFTGVGIYFGPDESGLSGFTGYYTMGTVIDSLTVNLNSTMTWGILADGVQQGSHIRRLNMLNVFNGGISIKDNKGGVFFKMSDIAVVGAPVMPASAGQPTGVAMRIEHGGCVQIDQYTTNGGGSGADENGIFLYGIQLLAGSLLLSNYQAEEVLYGLDITSTLSYAVSIDHALFANTSFGVPKGVWVHSTAVPVFNATNIIAGTGIRAIQNDADGYITPSSATYVAPSYIYNGGNATFIAKHQNTIVTGVKSNPTNSAGTFTPDVALGDWQLINLTTSPMTIAAPLYSGNAMPASLVGQEIVLTVFNGSAGAAPTVNFNAVFHLAGTLTVTTTGQNTSAKFRWTGTAWYQITPWCAVVTN